MISETECHGHNPREPFEEMDFAEMDRRLGLTEPGQSEADYFTQAIREVIMFLREPRTDLGKSIHLAAVTYHFLPGFSQGKGVPGWEQLELARQIGCTKAAVSKACVEFAERFHVTHSQMRSEDIRKKFSMQTTQRHAVRKALKLNPQILQKIV